MRVHSLVALACLVALTGCSRSSGAARAGEVVVMADGCAAHWQPPTSGRVTIRVRNTTPQQASIILLGSDQEREILDPQAVGAHATRTLTFGLNPGTYAWRCVVGTSTSRTGDLFTVAGSGVAAFDAVDPPTVAELTDAASAYHSSVVPLLDELAVDVDGLAAAVARGDEEGARTAWRTAHLDYVRLGAAYGTFGDADRRIDGTVDGLAGGTTDPSFTGFHEIEALLWGLGDAPGDAAAAVEQLRHDVADLITTFASEQVPTLDLTTRAHEILENGVEAELSGAADEGSHTELADLRAEVDATRLVIQALQPVLQQHQPTLLAATTSGVDSFASLLDSLSHADGSWPALDQLTSAQRSRVDGAAGGLLETLARIPIALEPLGDGD